MVQIRLARPEDAAALVGIYEPYVKETSITFEYDVPSVEEFTARIQAISEGFPYMVCEINGEIAGYAYAASFRERKAFQWDAELSVYVSPRFHRRGIAKVLYECVFQFLREMGYLTLYALVTIPNRDSIPFHERLGFYQIAKYPRTGYKLGKWHDMLVLEKRLAPKPDQPEPPHGFSTLPQEFVENVLRDAENKLEQYWNNR